MDNPEMAEGGEGVADEAPNIDEIEALAQEVEDSQTIPGPGQTPVPPKPPDLEKNPEKRQEIARREQKIWDNIRTILLDPEIVDTYIKSYDAKDKDSGTPEGYAAALNMSEKLRPEGGADSIQVEEGKRWWGQRGIRTLTSTRLKEVYELRLVNDEGEPVRIGYLNNVQIQKKTKEEDPLVLKLKEQKKK